jgi:3'-5' exoribonuclease
MFNKNEEDFVENLNSMREIITKFVFSDKEIKRSKNDNLYLEFVLSDKTGRIIGRTFPGKDINTIHDSVKLGKVYQIQGKLSEFPRGSGKYSIIINKFHQLPEEKYDMDDFTKHSDKNKEDMIIKIEETINSMENEHLTNLMNAFLQDKVFKEEFCNAPSAKFYHHNYNGGLLEHSVEVLDICKSVCEIFPELNKDLLYSGAILHDMGKIKAYDYDLLSINYSKEGKLLDHIFIACDMVKEKVRALADNGIIIPEEIITQVIHLILSHHGDINNGWGSPVSPQTPEAVTLHHADNLDAKVKGFLQK